MNRPQLPVVWIGLLAAAAAFLYFHRLDSTPPYLSIEEVSQAREAVIFATTGPADNGRPLALDSPEDDSRTLRDPLWIYLAPLWVSLAAVPLKVLPFSEALVRLPSACAGVLNVLLMFIVSREIFNSTRAAVIAAGLLMLTPAHFLQSRIGTGQIATVTFVLAWLIFMVRYINTDRQRDLSVATFCLGLGMYAYAGGLVILPVYFLVTLFVVRRRGGSTSTTALTAAGAGFGLAVVPLAIWHVLHPQHLVGLATYYTHGEYNKNLGWNGFLGANAISHLDAWWDCYNPDKLFFSGDSDLRYSTRSAGYFLLPAAIPMIAGAWYARRRLTSDTWVVLVSGLVFAPLPAALVSSSEIKRWLTFVPFALLAATCGAEWMLADRRRAVKACAIAVLLLGALQARSFFDDYFGRYRVASAINFGGNLRGAIHEILAVSSSNDCALLDADVYYLKEQWDLYTRAYGRTDLAKRTLWFGPNDAVQPRLSCPATTVLARAGDKRLADWHSIPVPELNGGVVLAVYRRHAP
jgi:hypothetical protein